MKSNYTVLVIDDEIDFLGIISSDLEQIGVEVYTASNGKDGLEFIQNHPQIDCVLCDVKMPGINGIELLKILRKDPEYKDLNFYLMSGYPEVFKDLDLKLLGPEFRLLKPINMDMFNQFIAV